jgi:hypothetical protein
VVVQSASPAQIVREPSKEHFEFMLHVLVAASADGTEAARASPETSDFVVLGNMLAGRMLRDCQRELQRQLKFSELSVRTGID